MIVNETMARRLWPGESAIGRRFTIWRDEKFPREVVGVVGDTKESLDKEADDETGVALILAAVVFIACLIPARRAAKIDPLEALR